MHRLSAHSILRAPKHNFEEHAHSYTLYSYIIDMNKLYGSKLVKIPAPKFYVLYNGVQRLENRILRLSDSFIINDGEPALELTVIIIDINYNSGEAALTRSTTLNGYSYLIAEIRRNLVAGMTRDAAISAAIDRCINQGILQEFLSNNYGEVIKMLNYEYNAEAERRVLWQEGMQEGIQKGRQEGIQGIDLIVKLQHEGLSLEEAVVEAKKTLS